MTPAKRLKEIEKSFDSECGWPLPSRDMEDVSWLIARVKTLTKALELIAKQTQLPITSTIARKALEKE